MAIVETSNIHALRLALERFEFFRAVIDDVALEDREWSRLDKYIVGVRDVLEHELRKEERDLIKSTPLG